MNLQFGSDVAATVEGDAVKTVCCESCDQSYSYQMIREGVGEGFNLLWSTRGAAEAEARKRAARDLRRKLAQDADLVPCPRCGHCQADMVKATKEKRHSWMTVVALLAGFVFIYALPMSLPGGKIGGRDRVIAGIVAAGTGLLAFGMAILQSTLRRNYDPNEMALADRLEIARSRCLSDVESPAADREDSPSAVGDIEEQAEDEESVSSSNWAAGFQFILYGILCEVLGLMLLGGLQPGQRWRALAACGLGGVFFLFAAKFYKRKS